jgi:hypothetical protein
MAHSLPSRLSVVLAASAAVSALAATPALATESNAPPPAALLPAGIGPVTFAPIPSLTAPAQQTRARRVVRAARLVPRRVRRGRRALLRISLATPSRVQIVMRRSASGHRIRVLSVPARGNTVALRLPARSGGHDLRPGRYRISIVAIDAQGIRSRPVVRTLRVRRAAG